MPDIIKNHLLRWKEEQERHKILQPNDYINSGYVCTMVDGSMIKPNYVSQHFKLLIKKADLPNVRFHDLRHSSASYLLYLGFNLKEIQEWLRHKDIQTTMNLYTHFDIASKRNLAESLGKRFEKFGS
jgi:integrase